MLDVFGERQQELLRSLHRNKKGMTIDELATALKVTRTAVKQHLISLEQSGYVEKGSLKLTRGGPGRAYLLSVKGIDLFPKQYSWFSSLLLRGIKAEHGSEHLAHHLRDMARSIAFTLKDRVATKSDAERAREVVKIMNELAYEAELEDGRDAVDDAVVAAIKANNCVYHHLAQEFPEVCQFDLELLANMTGGDIEHQECIIKGGGACRFAIRQAKADRLEQAKDGAPLHV